MALLRTQSDERLVDLTREGNDRAFEAIVERYRRPLLRYCSRLLPPSRAEDAVQQTFVNAYDAVRNGDTELRLRPWLYRIAHNASLNLLRQNGWSHEQLSEEIDGVETPPEALARNERLRAVLAAVRELPERQREAIVLRAVEGRSYDEIAAELGVTGGAVRQLLNRARNTLRSGVGALVPHAAIARIAAAGGDGSAIDRIVQASAGAGGVAGVAKLGTALLVAGAVVGGTTHSVVSGGSRHHGGNGAVGSSVREAADRSAGASAAGAGVRGEQASTVAQRVSRRAAADSSRRSSQRRRPRGQSHGEHTSTLVEHTRGDDSRSGSGGGSSGSGDDSHSGSSGSRDGGGSGTSGDGGGSSSRSGDSGSGGHDGGGSSGPVPTGTPTGDGGGSGGGDVMSNLSSGSGSSGDGSDSKSDMSGSSGSGRDGSGR